MICPSCQTDVAVTEQNFGALYTCQSCRAVYFINFEGIPEYGEVASLDSSVAVQSDESQPQAFTEVESFSDFSEVQLESSSDMNIQNLDQNESFNSIMGNHSTFNEVAQDIANFGNTEVNVASLNYDLHISGLDTLDILKSFKEAVEDPRFGWDVNELMKSIKNGQISFEKLNPVKAFMLSKRIKFLDIETKWKQNAIT